MELGRCSILDTQTIIQITGNRRHPTTMVTLYCLQADQEKLILFNALAVYGGAGYRVRAIQR